MSDELNNGVNWTQVNNPSIWGSSTDPLWRVRIADSTNALSVARCAAEESITIIQAHRAEIERLTAALATAEAERDAARQDRDIQTQRLNVALNIIKQDVADGDDIAHRGVLLSRVFDGGTIEGYRVSSNSGELIYEPDDFEDAWASLVRNAAPQPAAAPAVDAAPVYDVGGSIEQADTWLESAYRATTADLKIDRLRYAMNDVLDVLNYLVNRDEKKG